LILFFTEKLKLATKFLPSERRLSWGSWRKSYARNSSMRDNQQSVLILMNFEIKNKETIVDHLRSHQRNEIQVCLGALYLHQLKNNKSESSEVGSGLIWFPQGCSSRKKIISKQIEVSLYNWRYDMNIS
jgi:hypothetical protein